MTQSGDNKLMPVPRVTSSATLRSISKALVNEQVSLEWKICFFKVTSKILNPNIDRLLALEEKNEQSIFSCFSIKSLEGDFPRFSVRSNRNYFNFIIFYLLRIQNQIAK
jgi:hypothetical protein